MVARLPPYARGTPRELYMLMMLRVERVSEVGAVDTLHDERLRQRGHLPDRRYAA